MSMMKRSDAAANRGPIWPMLLIGVGALITVLWVGFLGVLTFRLLTGLVSTALGLAHQL